MVNLKGFKAYTLQDEYTSVVPIETNDSMDFLAGKEEVQKGDSFLKIHRPEFEFDEFMTKDKSNMYQILQKGKNNLSDFIKRGIFKKSEKEIGYLYRQVFEDKEQCGFLFCVHDDDYINGKILPHEQTFEDRVKRLQKGADHLGIYNSFPVTFSECDDYFEDIIKKTKDQQPLYVLNRNNVQHYLYSFDEVVSKQIIDIFKNIDHLYIADGHHRFKSYSREVNKLKESTNRKLLDDFYYYPVLIYQRKKLQTYTYHRVVRNIKNISSEVILEKAKRWFSIKKINLPDDDKSINYKAKLLNLPKLGKKGKFCIFFPTLKTWYKFKILPFKPNNPIESLDISYLSSHLLMDILQISDLKSSNHIEYVPETKRTIDKLEEECCYDKTTNLLIVCPRINLGEVKAVADQHTCMPPKSTYVYPKPLIGLLFKAFEFFE